MTDAAPLTEDTDGAAMRLRTPGRFRIVNRIGIVSTEPKELREVVEGQLSRAEVVVIADGANDPRHVAIDLLAQRRANVIDMVLRFVCVAQPT